MQSFDKYYISPDGTKIFYDLHLQNTNTCLIFLHGIAGDLTAWNKIRQNIENGSYSTIGIDLRGHGYSQVPKTTGPYSIDLFANDVIGILKMERFKKYVLVGHSLGGMIAIFLAENYLDLISKIVLIDTSYKIPGHLKWLKGVVGLDKIFNFIEKISPSWKLKFRKNYLDLAENSDITLKRFLLDLSHSSLKTIVSTAQGIIDFDASEKLKSIKTPTLILAGNKDIFYDMSEEVDLASKINNSKIKIFPDLSHICIIEDPKSVSDEILKFLD